MYKDVSVYSPSTKPEVKDIVSVQQSLINLVLTKAGERPFDPFYGLNSENMLFELADDTTALDLYNELIQKAKIYEPRAKLNTSQTQVVANLDERQIEITIVFEIIGFEGTNYQVTQAIRE